MNEEQTATDALAEAFAKVSDLQKPLRDAEGLRDAREAAALAAAPGWVPIEIAGKDAPDYLHRRLAQSVKDVQPGRGRQALQLSGEGRMEADLLLYRRDESEFVALVDAPFAEAAAELLDKYVLMDEVEVRGGWAQQVSLTLLGPKSGEVLEALLGKDVADELEADTWSAASGDCGGEALEVCRDGRWSTPCFQVLLPAGSFAELAGKFDVAVKAAGGGVVSGEVLNYLRIENGVTRFGTDTTVKTIPLEANLRPALDLDKGCFPGQEFLARINNLGHPANVLARLSFDGTAPVSPGDAVSEAGNPEGPAGRITSVQRLENVNEGLALATLPWKLRELSEGEIRAEGGGVKARVELLGEYPDASAKKPAP